MFLETPEIGLLDTALGRSSSEMLCTGVPLYIVIDWLGRGIDNLMECNTNCGLTVEERSHKIANFRTRQRLNDEASSRTN